MATTEECEHSIKLNEVIVRLAKVTGQMEPDAEIWHGDIDQIVDIAVGLLSMETGLDDGT